MYKRCLSYAWSVVLSKQNAHYSPWSNFLYYIPKNINRSPHINPRGRASSIAGLITSNLRQSQRRYVECRIKDKQGKYTWEQVWNQIIYKTNFSLLKQECKYNDLESKVNKNVDIKFGAHDTFLEQPSSGTLNIVILESQII